MKVIVNKETGIEFPYTDLLANQIADGYLPNLEIVEKEDESKKTRRKKEEEG